MSCFLRSQMTVGYLANFCQRMPWLLGGTVTATGGAAANLHRVITGKRFSQSTQSVGGVRKDSTSITQKTYAGIALIDLPHSTMYAEQRKQNLCGKGNPNCILAGPTARPHPYQNTLASCSKQSTFGSRSAVQMLASSQGITKPASTNGKKCINYFFLDQNRPDVSSIQTIKTLTCPYTGMGVPITLSERQESLI